MEYSQEHVQRVDAFLLAKQGFFPAESIPMIRQKLLQMDESRFWTVQSIDFKDPTTLLILSIFLGCFGVDRFMLGDTGIGILKLLTGGVCGILTIIDWFSIQKMTREKNLERIMQL